LGVFAASVLGSLHCAGMCGPLVAAYAGMPGSDAPWRRRAAAHAAYNIGRLAAYLALGAMAGAFGATLNRAGAWVGITRGAAIVSGSLIAIWGLHALLAARGIRVPRLDAPAPLKRAVAATMRAVAGTPQIARAAILGLASALLPCGWLYAFVATAAGFGSLAGGVLVMAIFWAGTLPAMLAFGEVVRALSGPMRRHVPAACAVVLMIIGLWTVFGRSGFGPFGPRNDTPRMACHGTP
jgi:sulfite exporter TauE/SafE